MYNNKIEQYIPEALMLQTLMTFKYSGVLFNTLTVIIGSLVGLAFKTAIPKKLTDALMCAIGVCTVYIGISGAVLAGNSCDSSPLIPIISIALGVAVGTILDIDGALDRLGRAVEGRFKKSDGDGNIAAGFVAACLLFCVGSMTIVGGLNAGISGDNTLYFTKSILDLVSAMALSVSFGIGVVLSSGFVLGFQGLLVLTSGLLEPLLDSHMINEMNCVGSLLILIIGLNLMKITKIKVADYLPAIPIAMLLAVFM